MLFEEQVSYDGVTSEVVLQLLDYQAFFNKLSLDLPSNDVLYCGSIDFHEIHFLNRDYDQIFSLIESNNKALGWTGSVKGILYHTNNHPGTIT